MSLEWCSLTATQARGWPQGYLNGSFSNPIFAVLSLFHHLNHWIFAFQISWGTRAWSAAAVRMIFRAKITSCSWKTATSWKGHFSRALQSINTEEDTFPSSQGAHGWFSKFLTWFVYIWAAWYFRGQYNETRKTTVLVDMDWSWANYSW